MSYLSTKLYPREGKQRKNYEIQESLLEGLQELTRIYDATIPVLINMCVAYLIETENFIFYERDGKDNLVPRTIGMRESNLIGLEKLAAKTGIGISRLVNIAIINILKEEQRYRGANV